LTFEPRVKVGHVREDVGQEEVEQRPELVQVVLQRRSRPMLPRRPPLRLPMPPPRPRSTTRLRTRSSKVGHVREDVGQEEVEQRPELVQVVLQRRAGDQESEATATSTADAAAQAKVDDEASNKVVKQLHAVLRPFAASEVSP
jgi:hypothetical protein